MASDDAMMMDTGARFKPPGEPPDGGCTWANMVAGGQKGGGPVPESVVDAAFVTERMSVEFPDGEDGEPVITIGQEVLEAMNGLWKQCIIVKVLGRNVGLPVLNRRLRDLWKPQGGMSVTDLPRQFFIIRFEKEEEYLAALTGGPWRVFGSYLMVQRWTPEFDPMRDEIVTTPVWVRLSNIPVNFYHEAILLGIAKGVGKPVRVDWTTLQLERARFARVCVEVNLAKPLKGTVRINGERYFVSYEGLAQICSLCGVYGHAVHKCPKQPVEIVRDRVEVVPPATSPRAEQSKAPTEEGFTTVQQLNRRGRRNEVYRRKETGEVGDTALGNHGRNLREIMNPVDMETNHSQNRFSSLMEDTVSSGDMEIGNESNSNKENELIKEAALIVPQSSQQAQIKEVSFGGKNELNGQKQNGPMNKKKNGPKEKIGPLKSKGKISQKPTRGLIFGPTRKEMEMSASGKRLRVDDGEIGRSGGAFVSDRGQSSPANLQQLNDISIVERSAPHEEPRAEVISNNVPLVSTEGSTDA